MDSSLPPYSRRPLSLAGQRGAFSLVELLMVVGIMALVMSILMPALGTLRATGQQVYCLSNMREVGKATFMYSNDYKELTPLSHVGPDGTGTANLNHQAYSDLLMKYLKDTVTMDGNKVDLINYETIRVFDCPSTDLRPKDGSRFAGHIDSNNGAEIEYGMNNHARINNLNGFWKDNYMPTLIHRKRDEVMNHDVVFFAETEGDWDPERWGAVSRAQNKIEWPLVASLGDDHYLASGTPPASLPHDYYLQAADGFRYDSGGGFGDPKYPNNSRPDAYLRHRDGYNVVQLDGAGTWHSGLVDDADGDYDIDSDDIFRYLRKFHARKVVRKDMEANEWVPPWAVDTGSGELP